MHFQLKTVITNQIFFPFRIAHSEDSFLIPACKVFESMRLLFFYKKSRNIQECSILISHPYFITAYWPSQIYYFFTYREKALVNDIKFIAENLNKSNSCFRNSLEFRKILKKALIIIIIIISSSSSNIIIIIIRLTPTLADGFSQ